MKKEPWQWYLKFEIFVNEHGYTWCHIDHFIYFNKLDDENYIILCLYVDDMLVARYNIDHIKGLKELLAHSFAMKNLGEVNKIIGIKISRDRKNKKLTLS